jgi:isoaspartyl peptidase/L-asparaginase-like protein (Ntn-hydrolase superfamily)
MSRLAPAVAVVLLVAACREREARPPAPPPTPWKAAAVAHAGVGSPPERSDGCRAAVDAALAVLERGGDPLDAAVAGVVVLEDDPRFNAGTGSRVRIDGVTVQMDASVMRSSGEFAAVAGIEAVKNPVTVARLVLDSPHTFLAGDGATRFARAHGIPPYDPTTPQTRESARKRLQDLAAGTDLPPEWVGFDWRAAWNFERPLAEALGGAPSPAPAEVSSDTVGVVVRAADGRFAAALSTGGTTITLRGRVGDVPIRGAGLWAGPWGAVANTGTGERIVEADLARWVHAQLERDPDAARAARLGADRLAGTDVGVIVVSPTSMGAASSQPMAWAGRELGSTEWQGP